MLGLRRVTVTVRFRLGKPQRWDETGESKPGDPPTPYQGPHKPSKHRVFPSKAPGFLVCEHLVFSWFAWPSLVGCSRAKRASSVRVLTHRPGRRVGGRPGAPALRNESMATLDWPPVTWGLSVSSSPKSWESLVPSVIEHESMSGQVPVWSSDFIFSSHFTIHETTDFRRGHGSDPVSGGPGSWPCTREWPICICRGGSRQTEVQTSWRQLDHLLFLGRVEIE